LFKISLQKRHIVVRKQTLKIKSINESEEIKMAKNWRPGDALDVIRAGEDKEAIADICRRFPMFAINATSEAGLVELIKAIPSHISARQINKGLIEGVEPYEYDEDADEVEEKTEKAEKDKGKKEKKDKDKKDKAAGKGKKKASKKEKEVEEDEWDDEDEATEGGPDFSKMSQSDLKEAAKELGCKIKKGMTKADVVAMLEKAAGKTEDDEDDEDDWDI